MKSSSSRDREFRRLTRHHWHWSSCYHPSQNGSEELRYVRVGREGATKTFLRVRPWKTSRTLYVWRLHGVLTSARFLLATGSIGDRYGRPLEAGPLKPSHKSEFFQHSLCNMYSRGVNVDPSFVRVH